MLEPRGHSLFCCAVQARRGHRHQGFKTHGKRLGGKGLFRDQPRAARLGNGFGIRGLLTGMAMRFLSGYSATRRYVADASYWLYLVHIPVVMALQVAVSQLPWAWWIKFPLILGVTFPLLFASYHLFVRYSFIGAILNGRRESPSRRRAPVTAGVMAEDTQLTAKSSPHATTSPSCAV